MAPTHSPAGICPLCSGRLKLRPNPLRRACVACDYAEPAGAVTTAPQPRLVRLPWRPAHDDDYGDPAGCGGAGR